MIFQKQSFKTLNSKTMYNYFLENLNFRTKTISVAMQRDNML